MAADPNTAPPTAKSARAPASRRGIRTRNRIVEAAVRVFAEKGLIDATMHDIGREAGLSSGTVYRYFVDKADVFDFLLRELQDTLHEEATFPIGDRGEILVREAVLRFFELYREHAVLYRVLWETLEPPSPFSEAWIEMHDSNRDAIARALRHGKRRGATVPDLDVPLTAELAVLLFERPTFTRLIMGWDEDVTDDDVTAVIEGMLGTGVHPGAG
jgi:AcrR family transcriptional regulator